MELRPRIGGQQRAVLILGIVAWILSCCDAVSYVRAHTTQRLVREKAANAAVDLSTQETVSGSDAARVQDRIQMDGRAVRSDQREIAAAQTQQRNPARAQQELAADLATLNADKMMAYTVENFSRTDPDPKLMQARDQVDVYQAALLEASVTMHRDIRFAYVLAAVWALVGITAFLAFRNSAPSTGAQPKSEQI